MHASNYIYYHDTQELHGYLAFDDEQKNVRPVVIVAHDWSGRNEFAIQKAVELARMGYIGFALDMYGWGKTGSTVEEKTTLMNPLLASRTLLCNRVQAAVQALANISEADTNRIAVIGFCFGGLCALDLARSGATIQGVVSFHGLLGKPEPFEAKKIKAKILVLHGYNDPMVSPDAVSAFCDEMTKAEADWQVHMYGQAQHGFTNPEAHDTQLGIIYNAIAEQRAWQAMTNFLQEIF